MLILCADESMSIKLGYKRNHLEVKNKRREREGERETWPTQHIDRVIVYSDRKFVSIAHRI